IALRLGLYQLRFLTRIPAHAAINESVNLVKEQKKTSAAPLVNAVLRAAERDLEMNLAQLVQDPNLRLSIETSHPQWLVPRWMARFGQQEASRLAMANNHAPAASFRFNSQIASVQQTRDWLTAQGIELQASRLAPGAAVIESGTISSQSKPVLQGWIYPQDEASQLVAHLASSHDLKFQIPNFKFLDLCA